jgi:hypothetical protein
LQRVSPNVRHLPAIGNSRTFAFGLGVAGQIAAALLK